MSLTRCPQCGRVADPPSCFACGFEWSTEVQAAPQPEAVSVGNDQWSVPAQGSAPLKTKSAPVPAIPAEVPAAVPADIQMGLPNPFGEGANTPPPETKADVVQISDSLDELGDIFGGEQSEGTGEIAFADVPLPDISGLGNDLDGAISELESELAAAAVPLDPEPAGADSDEDIPAVVAGIEETDVDLTGLPNDIFGEDASVEDIPSLLPEIEGVALDESLPEPEGLPDDLFGALDETPEPPPAGVPPGVPALDTPEFAMPDPDVDGLELDDLAALDLDAPEPPADIPALTAEASALNGKSAEELAGFVVRVEEFAENFENEGRIGEAAFLYELKAFLDTLK